MRHDLTLRLLCGVGAAAALAGILVYAQARRTLVANFDAAQAAKACAIVFLLELEDGWLEFDLEPGMMPEFEGGSEPEYYQLWLSDGQALDRSVTLAEGVDLPRRLGDLVGPQGFDLDLPDGRPGRAIGVTARIGADREEDDEREAQAADPGAEGPPSATEYVEIGLTVARSRATLDKALATVRDAVLLAGGALGLAIWLLVPRLVRRGLRPLDAMGERVASIDADSLAYRLDAAGLPAELRGPAEKVNELLARLQAAFERERRMTGNVAHELRTPIAELRAAMDVAARWPEDAGLGRAAIDTGVAVALRMSDLVAGLLRLARIEGGSARPVPEDVDLHELVEELWRSLAPRSFARGVEFEHRTLPGAVLRADRTLLSMAVMNLLDNAARFAPRESTITCEAERHEDGELTWTLRNRNEALAEDDLRHLTEPFWQRGAARGGSSHAGLGLALVESVAKVLGLRLHFSCGQDFEVCLSTGGPRTVGAAAGQ